MLGARRPLSFVDVRELSLWDDGLRPQQREVAGVERGNYLLLAGPGTGKTFVLVRRVQYLIDELRLQPTRVVALTFTRAAAGEMRQRLDERLGGARPRVSTLPLLCSTRTTDPRDRSNPQTGPSS